MSDLKFRANAVTTVKRDAHGLSVYMRDGEQALPVIRLDYARLSDAVRAEGFGYGMEVRLTRQAAIERDEKTGKPASARQKHKKIADLAAHYMTGTDQWRMDGGGGGGLGAEARDLITALVEVFGLDEATAETQVREMDSATRTALAVDADLKPAIDAIKARRAEGVDTQSLKDKLLAMAK